MNLFSYILPRDYGFAPNPFNGICTLATCKPRIRQAANVGDWIVGTGSKSIGDIAGRLIYTMKVSEKITFNEYWNDARFQKKKPHMNGSLKQAFGDNIYFYDGKKEKWHQENSHHSYENGKVNYNNLNRDTSVQYILLSDHFFYFGINHVKIPDSLKDICAPTQGHKSNHDPKLVVAFVNWLERRFRPGFLGDPLLFKEFERYSGIGKK